MPTIVQAPGDTEAETFGKSVFCGQLPDDRDREGGGCRRRDWRVIRPNVWPPWTRRLICRGCGRRTDVTLPEIERRHRSNQGSGLGGDD